MACYCVCIVVCCSCEQQAALVEGVTVDGLYISLVVGSNWCEDGAVI